MPPDAVPAERSTAIILPPERSELEQYRDLARTLLEALRQWMLLPIPPIMITKAEAGRLCGMSIATYDKYVKLGLLPGPNATGRISVAALRQACHRLDGLSDVAAESGLDSADRAFAEWEKA